ncbi:glutathione-disulfide reductase [Sphingopyxis sp. OPL5]|uniref:glutathione-disulfide reductase n=1 Tax=Sphingopyxis sp. OPL5 TaxID=2486273 RepID=UPI00164DB50C|nr:glutathione-disulfide reductase [Sphingopyxis sp. OPL5]QNO27228.1 glutathione-disulfide reductase [Sphingopyxis sp. OPL5]
MTDYDYDLFVIGAGSGGVRASRIAEGHGARVAVAEEHRIGGTCVIRGCVPKKLLVYASAFAEELQDTARLGWTFGGMRFDWTALRDFVSSDVARLEKAYIDTLDAHGIARFQERATVAGPNKVRLASGREISARYILIAVGAWPVVPEFPGNQWAITSNEVFHLETLPERVVIQGAGYIAMEFASIFNALGAKVTMVSRSDRILRGYDESLTERLLKITRARGIDFHFHDPIVRADRQDDGSLLVGLEGGERIAADIMLVAAGRRPKTKGLGLENAGITLGDAGEVPVDRHNATCCPSIYAVGDVTNRIQLTPVAIREGQAFADTVFGRAPRVVSYDHVPNVVFSQPPLAGVGLTEAQARAQGLKIAIFTSDFRPMKNMFSTRVERGFYKLVVDADSERVLGVHMIGPDTPEILQAVAIAVKAGLTKADFDATMALHPSMAEELVLMHSAA